MSKEVVKAEDFGLNEIQATEIQKGLQQIIEERNILSQSYSEIIQLEITTENLIKFRELRLKIRDNRTKGIEPWHKTNKEFYLRGGQFLDAIKKKEVMENERMETNLLENENFFENKEKERLQTLHNERFAIASQFVEDLTGINFSDMEEDVFTAYISAKQKQFNEQLEAKRQAEIDAIQREQKVILFNERKNQLIPYWNFLDENEDLIDYSEISKFDFQILLNKVKLNKSKHDEQQEKIRLENEKLKAEADERDRLQAERIKQDEDLRLKEKQEFEAKLKIENDKRLKIEADLKAKELAENIRLDNLRLEEQKRTESLRLEELQPDRQKITKWLNDCHLSFTPNVNPEFHKVACEIHQRHEGFLKWANELINSVK